MVDTESDAKTMEQHLSFQRILLTGFRATGKSLLGRLLAARLGWGFLDTDTLLCKKFGCSVAEFVEEKGWPCFRQREKQLLLDLCTRSFVVIATGGGSVLHEAAWRSLRQGSVTVWLQADESTVCNRLEGDCCSPQQRPPLTEKDPASEVAVLLHERTPFYQQGSDFSVHTDGRTPQELVDDIVQELKTTI